MQTTARGQVSARFCPSNSATLRPAPSSLQIHTASTGRSHFITAFFDIINFRTEPTVILVYAMAIAVSSSRVVTALQLEQIRRMHIISFALRDVRHAEATALELDARSQSTM